ncbi:MAG: HNH endonuclease, partial [Actinomycetota bacterium]|nr:HNH endonuclease [Actinomycetota bacterium]
AHHLKPWYHGGRTDLNNLILLCRRHHRAVHQRTWRIHALGGGCFRFSHTGQAAAAEYERQPRAG